MGHNALGTITIDRILNGTYPAPAELKDALRDPATRQAFLGGSVGPDLFPNKTHRGSQSEFTQKMVGDAMSKYRAAQSPEDRAKAGEALAFAYGWLSHVAMDLNVHPKINAVIGDTYDYNNAGEKATHAALEAQLYAYLRRVVGSKDPFDARFPTDFVSEQLGVEPGELKRAISRIRIIAAGEIAAANQVKLSDKQLKDIWSEFVRNGMQDTREFIEDTKSFENWDLDCGKISTEDFEWLRKTMLELNGGKLPKDWGKRYLDYWNLVKGLNPGDRAARLSEALGKPGTPPVVSSGIPGTAVYLAKQNMNLFIRVDRDTLLPTRQRMPDAKVEWSGAKFRWKSRFEDYPYMKEVLVEGEMGDDEVVSLKFTMTQSLTDRPEVTFTTEIEARHVPRVPNGLWDEYQGDVTFAAFNEIQAPAFTGSMRSSSGSAIWDKTTVKEAGKGRTLYPILAIRFRDKKYG